MKTRNNKLFSVLAVLLCSTIVFAIDENYYNSNGFEDARVGYVVDDAGSKFDKNTFSEGDYKCVQYVSEVPFAGKRCVKLAGDSDYAGIRFIPSKQLTGDQMCYYDLRLSVPTPDSMGNSLFTYDGFKIVIKYDASAEFKGTTFVLITFHNNGKIYLSVNKNSYAMGEWIPNKYFRLTVGIKPSAPQTIICWINGEQKAIASVEKPIDEKIGGMQIHWSKPFKKGGVAYVDNVSISNVSPWDRNEPK